MPIRVGVINAIHDHFFQVGTQNANAGNDLASLGFRTIKIWPTVPIEHPDVQAVVQNPAFDVIMIRPLENSQLVTEPTCSGGSITYYRWEDIDYGQVATRLYQAYGNLNKIIILTGWENDHQIKGLGCPQNPSAGEEDDFLQMLDDRQSGVTLARALRSGFPLKVYHAVEVNQALVTNYRVIDEIVPNMSATPDFVAYTAYSSGSFLGSLAHIEAVTGLPRERIIVGEWGLEESPSRSQYSGIFNKFQSALDWGVHLVYMWNYRDEFGCPKNRGTWLRRCFNGSSAWQADSLSTAYQALVDLISMYETP